MLTVRMYTYINIFKIWVTNVDPKGAKCYQPITLSYIYPYSIYFLLLLITRVVILQVRKISYFFLSSIFSYENRTLTYLDFTPMFSSFFIMGANFINLLFFFLKTNSQNTR